GYAVGIDLTRRDLQDDAKALRRPWDWSKGFDRSAPCGPLTPAARWRAPSQGRIWLAVDGEIRQNADLADLIWPVEDVIAICSEGMELQPGDLIFTGTPAGVGAIEPGQRVTGGIDGLEGIDIRVANKSA
ncbi:fumarylacetoacetate hydrolase family protein, partial [Rhizobiaceae sp. 2RAB30]